MNEWLEIAIAIKNWLTLLGICSAGYFTLVGIACVFDREARQFMKSVAVKIRSDFAKLLLKVFYHEDA